MVCDDVMAELSWCRAGLLDVARCPFGQRILAVVQQAGRRTNEMHRTQDSYVSASCNCRGECSMEASARAWGVGDLEGRSAAKPCRLPLMFCCI